MAATYRLNKSELTRLRRETKMYGQFLPVLKLKKEQLQIEHLQLKREMAQAETVLKEAREGLDGIVPLLAEPLPVNVPAMARPLDVVLEEKIIAGVKAPAIKEIVFPSYTSSHFGTPPWVNRAMPRLHELVRRNIELKVLTDQYHAIGRELRKATQKVNLFEKVLIPEAKEAVRRIEIALGDQEVAAVCRGKLAKSRKVKAAEGQA